MKYIKGHTNESNAYEVANYPWGFRLKTKKRYWIETTSRGDRFVSQTLNPKTNKWCKPKKSTYMALMSLIIKDNGHVNYIGVYKGSDKTNIDSFIDKVGKDSLSDQQLKSLEDLYKIDKVMQNITVEIVKEDPKEKREKEASQIKDLNDAKNRLEKELEGLFPFINITVTNNLVPSLQIALSLDEKSKWTNNYFENSRYIRATIYPYSKAMQWVGEDLTGLYTFSIRPSYKVKGISTRDIKKGKDIKSVIKHAVKQVKKYQEAK